MVHLDRAAAADSIDVRVLSDGQHCVVTGRQIRFDAVGKYLQETLQAPHDHLIRIFVDGTERSEDRGQLIRGIVRSAGYTRIIIVGFITEPGQGKLQL